jgi:uncharacterized membrane protein
MNLVLLSLLMLSWNLTMMIFVAFVVVIVLMFGRHMGRKRDGWYETRARSRKSENLETKVI